MTWSCRAPASPCTSKVLRAVPRARRGSVLRYGARDQSYWRARVSVWPARETNLATLLLPLRSQSGCSWIPRHQCRPASRFSLFPLVGLTSRDLRRSPSLEVIRQGLNEDYVRLGGDRG